jgi:alpha-mannosidase
VTATSQLANPHVPPSTFCLPPPSLIVHLVSHTHWDREWYRPAGRFRQLLVPLIDELLAAPPSAGTSFLLDGQTVLLDDYLAVRPENAAELAAQLRAGTLEAGPWFVLADELIPSAEALVRNLLAGHRVLRGLRSGFPEVLYCPDSFGHPAALPELARGFGLGVVIVWRGFGGTRWPEGDACWWSAPSGARVLLYHLSREGYELGANLPVDPADAAKRWESIRHAIVDRSRLGVALLLNGADHHRRQLHLNDAVRSLRGAAAPVTVVASSLSWFARAADAEAGAANLPKIRGELRDSYGYTYTLQGTLATRASQKRRAALVDRLLTRDAEPWVALLPAGARRARRALVHAAWREALLCHPHDTLCGCSIDEVARAFEARMDDATAQGEGIRDDTLLELLGQDRVAARTRHDAWRPHLLVRNPAARSRAGVAIVEHAVFLGDVRVGGGAAGAPIGVGRHRIPRVSGLGTPQVLDRSIAHDRTESPRHYPDDDLVEIVRTAVWVPAMSGYAVRAFPTGAAGKQPPLPPNPVRSSAGEISNGRIAVRVWEDGRVELHDAESQRTISGLLAIEHQDDLGDLYTPSPRGAVGIARFLGARIRHRGPLRGAIDTRWRADVRKGERVDLVIRISLDADARAVRIEISGDNGARDCRLRFRVSTDVVHPQVFADAAFGPIAREPLHVPSEETSAEAVVTTAPLHRYVSLFDADRGATLFSDGLAEYEADGGGSIHLTLVRAVGELSRDDLPERPGHVGWPTATPGAQCIGPFRAECAVLLHGARDEATIGLIERTADDILVPLTGSTLRSAIDIASEAGGVTLEGDGLAFSCAKDSDDGEWLVLRCVNLLDREVAGRWALRDTVREARASRLDETPGEPLELVRDGIAFQAPPRAVVTILVGR